MAISAFDRELQPKSTTQHTRITELGPGNGFRSSCDPAPLPRPSPALKTVRRPCGGCCRCWFVTRPHAPKSTAARPRPAAWHRPSAGARRAGAAPPRRRPPPRRPWTSMARSRRLSTASCRGRRASKRSSSMAKRYARRRRRAGLGGDAPLCAPVGGAVSGDDGWRAVEF